MSVVIDFDKAVALLTKLPKDAVKENNAQPCSALRCPYRVALEKSRRALERIADALLDSE